MYVRRTIYFILVIACCTGVVYSQQSNVDQRHRRSKIVQTPDFRFRDRVLDLAFPYQRFVPAGQTIIVLRFMPSFHPESQIEICVKTSGAAEIHFMKASVQLARIINSGVSDVENAAREMHIKSKETAINADAARLWMERFWYPSQNRLLI